MFNSEEMKNLRNALEAWIRSEPKRLIKIAKKFVEEYLDDDEEEEKEKNEYC